MIRKKMYAAIVGFVVFTAGSALADFIVEEKIVEDTYSGVYTVNGKQYIVDSVGMSADLNDPSDPNYNIESMAVSLSVDKLLTIKLTPGSENYFDLWRKGDASYAPGSLFLSTDGDSVASNTASPVERWNYAITLDGLFVNGRDENNGTSSLYEVKRGDVVRAGAERQDENSALYRPSATNIALAEQLAGWQFVDNGGVLELVIRMVLPDTIIESLEKSHNLGVQWSQVCANDVIKADIKSSHSEVPEPMTMALFGFGLLGLAGAMKRK